MSAEASSADRHDIAGRDPPEQRPAEQLPPAFRMVHGTKPWLVVAAIVGIFVLCLGYATILLMKETTALRISARAGSWIAVQAEIEYLRFRNALDRFALGQPGAERDDLLQRFEVLWSRLPLVVEGHEGDALHRIPGAVETVAQAVATLEAIEGDILALRPGDAAAHARLQAALKPLGLGLHGLVQHAVIDLPDKLTREELHGTLTAIVISLCGALGSGALLIVMLVRGLRHSRDLMEREHAARLRAELADRTKSQFLANTSHELRTPLNAIIGFSELMRQQSFGPLGSARYLEYVQDIEDSGRRLLEVINAVLELSRIEAGTLIPKDNEIRMIELVEAACRILRPQATAKSVELTLAIDNEGPQVRGDPRLLGQAVTHVIGNAVKFTQPGGRVEVGWRFGADGAIGVRVRDTGIGMSAEELAVALKPFGQADRNLDRRYEGIGLGLPLAKSIVERHGGRLEIESAPRRGTQVVLWLPALGSCQGLAKPAGPSSCSSASFTPLRGEL